MTLSLLASALLAPALLASALLASALLVLAVCLAAGRLLAATARLSLEWPLRFLTGAALLSHAILALGLAGFANLPAFATLAAVTLLAAALASSPGPRPEPRQKWLWLALAPFALVYLVHALAPEISPDGLAYHVALPLRYLREGRIGFVPYNIYGQLSQGMEMLYLMAVAFAGRSAAALVHLGFLFALTALLWRHGREVATRGVAFTACALVFCSPVVGIDAASAYTDVAAAAVLLGSYVALHRWRNEPTPGLAVVAGLLAGFGFGIKYTAALGVAIGFVWLMGRQRRAALLFTAAALAMMLPWLAKNWAFTGNPVAPFFNAWFPNPVFDQWLEADYLKSLRWYPGLGALSTLPWELTGRGFVLNGLLGPVWLLAPLGLCAVRQNEARRLLLVGFVLALPLATNVGTRFLIPALPFFALALAMALATARARWRWVLLGVAGLHMILSWPWVASFYTHPYAWRINEFPWQAALRIEPDKAFEARKLTEHHMAQHLNRFVRPGERVLTQTQFTDALTHADMLTGALSRPTVEWRRMLYLTAVPRLLPNARFRFWFRTNRYQALRLRQRNGPPLSIAECQVYRLLTPVAIHAGGSALDDTLHGTLHGSLHGSLHGTLDGTLDGAVKGTLNGAVNGAWNGVANGALDGTAVTRAILDRPLEIRLSQPAEVDRLDCIYHSLPPDPEMVLEAQDAGTPEAGTPAAWHSVADHLERTPYADPMQHLPEIPGLPVQAARILLQHNINFLLLRDRDYHRDLGGLTAEKNMAAWPVERLASEYGMHLYRIHRNRLKPNSPVP